MKLRTLFKTTVFAMTLGSFSSSAATIDLFLTDQAEIVAAGPAHPAAGPTTIGSTVDGGDIVGGERDIWLDAGDNVKLSALVGASELNIASSIGGSGTDFDFTAIIQWDGDDNDPTPAGFDTAGFSEDLSPLDGFLVTLLSSDDVGTFIVDMWDAAGEQASVGFGFIAVDPLLPPVDFFIDFGFFTGDTALTAAEFDPAAPFGSPNPAFDFSTVSAIQVVINGTGNLDLRVASVTAVPAPDSIALMGLALLGLAGMSRFRA